MSKIFINDLRGWDESDPFTLPIIGAIDALEREGVIASDIDKRMKTVGEASLALSEHLDYYNFILLPHLNILLPEFRKNKIGNTDYKKFLEIAMYMTFSINTLSTINELTKKFVLAILRYMGLIKNEMTEFELLDMAKKIIIKAQGENNFNEWYSFIEKTRNFCEHEGALQPSYIDSDNADLFFIKKNTDREQKISLNDIANHLSKFSEIRLATQKGLQTKEFWKEVLINQSK